MDGFDKIAVITIAKLHGRVVRAQKNATILPITINIAKTGGFDKRDDSKNDVDQTLFL